MSDFQKADIIAVTHCLEGRTDAFNELVDRYHRQIFTLALRMTGSRDDAEEITQIVFIKAFEHLHTFDRKRKFFSWIYRIGINESLNAMNSHHPHTEYDDTLACDDPSPEARVLARERHGAVQAALMNLKTEHREVVVLRHYQELSYAEIAEVLRIPEKTVKSRLFTARSILACALKTEGAR